MAHKMGPFVAARREVGERVAAPAAARSQIAARAAAPVPETRPEPGSRTPATIA